MAKAPCPLPNGFPLPVGTTQTARALIRMHQYLRGELTKREEDGDVLVAPDVCHQQMAAIETLLAFMRVNFEPKTLKARRAYPKIGPLEYGEIRSGALRALKLAGDWQTYEQIACAIEDQHNLQLTDPQRRHFLQKLREGVHALKKAGAVVCERQHQLGDNEVQRWRLSSLFD